MKKIIATIGQGFVGSALTTVMSRTYDVYAYDKANQYAPGATKGVDITKQGGLIVGDRYRHPRSIQELVTACEAQEAFTGVYFVCLPTPMKVSGECDVSIVEGVLDELSKAFSEMASPWKLRDASNKSLRIAVVKSTVPPGTTAHWSVRYAASGLHVVFQPEFLTEANALRDFEEQTRIVIGGEHPYSDAVAAVFKPAFPSAQIIKTSSTNAEMVKYLTNTFLATKVAFANEMKMLCDATGADYDRVVEVARHDDRLGDTHWAVPGPDGHRGFGGSCFPKDINALMASALAQGIRMPVLEGAWATNLEVRPERDWEQLKGRAVAADFSSQR